MSKHRPPRAKLSTHASPDNRRRAEVPVFDISQAFGVLQELIGRADALVYAVERHFERFGWRCRDEVDQTDHPVAHLAHLIGAARDASITAVSASNVIAGELAKRGGSV